LALKSQRDFKAQCQSSCFFGVVQYCY